MLLLLYKRLDVAYKLVILHLQSLKILDFANTIAQLKEAERRLQDIETLRSKSLDTALLIRKPTKLKKPPPRFKVRKCYYYYFTNYKRLKCPKYLKTLKSQRAYNKAQQAKSVIDILKLFVKNALTTQAAITLNQDSQIVNSRTS